MVPNVGTGVVLVRYTRVPWVLYKNDQKCTMDYGYLWVGYKGRMAILVKYAEGLV